MVEMVVLICKDDRDSRTKRTQVIMPSVHTIFLFFPVCLMPFQRNIVFYMLIVILFHRPFYRRSGRLDFSTEQVKLPYFFAFWRGASIRWTS